MEIHPVTALMPPLSESAFAALKEDIKKHGLREPIWVKDGKVIDGRHRLRACEELGITPATREISDDNLAACVMSANYFRRHLSINSQKARKALAENPGLSDRALAKSAGVAHTTVARVRESANGANTLHKEPRTESTGRKARGRQPGIREGYKPKQERVAEIKSLLESGHNVEQVAEAIGLSTSTVDDYITRSGMKRPMPKTSSKTGKISTLGIAKATVNVLSSVTQGLQMCKRKGITISKEDATDLLEELHQSLPLIHWLDKQLKEIANG